MDLWPLIAEERTSLLGKFESLRDDQWDTPSLCGDWTLRQLLGHLVIAADPPVGRFLGEMVKAGGRFPVAQGRLARAEASRATTELVARYRERIGARRTPPGFGPSAPYADVVIHSFDAQIPLGLPSERPPERYEPPLGLLMTRKALAFFVPPGRPEVRWVADDHTWVAGTGAEVHGTMADLMLAASGRSARVEALSGPGQSALVAWLRS